MICAALAAFVCAFAFPLIIYAATLAAAAAFDKDLANDAPSTQRAYQHASQRVSTPLAAWPHGFSE